MWSIQLARPFSEPKALPDADTLREVFDYNREAGTIAWARRPEGAHRANWWNAVLAGRAAGSTHPGTRYLRVMLYGHHHFVHRIIWKLETGEDAAFVDHINGDGADNRFQNLRSVSFCDNMKNKALYKNNPHGFPGVSFHKRDRIWTARIGVAGKQIQLGSFKTKDEAIASMIGARVVLNFHPNHGREAK